MLEISIHNNKGQKIFDYKKNNSPKLYGVAALIASPSIKQIMDNSKIAIENADKVTNEFNATMQRFEESLKGSEIALGEANKLIDSFYEATNKTSPKLKNIDLDISNTGKFKEWLIGESDKISDVCGVNEDWINNQIQQGVQGIEDKKGTLERIADNLDKLGKFYDDTVWCIQNPAHTAHIIINWIIKYGTWAVIIYIVIQLGLLAYTTGRVENEVTTKIKNRISITIVIYIAILILNLILKLYLGL